MGKLYDIFKASKLGAGAAPDYYTSLIAQSLSKGSAKEYELTDAPPLLFASDGQPITTWTIWGNTVQDSIPIPLQPVEVAGVGILDNGQYIIPISCGGTTEVVQLKDVQSTRYIQKLILTGEETWFFNSGFFYNQNIIPDYLRTSNRIVYCTHYQGINSVTAGGQVGNGECSFYSVAGAKRLYICDNNFTTLADFKAYLAAQYANGTPVTVWYVIAEPTTGIVNEPLMKIGNYADSILNSASIPTVKGNNTLSVDTDVQPSQMYIKYYK